MLKIRYSQVYKCSKYKTALKSLPEAIPGALKLLEAL